MIKKFAATGLALMMAASLAGCGSGNQNTAPAGSTAYYTLTLYILALIQFQPFFWFRILHMPGLYIHSHLLQASMFQ